MRRALLAAVLGLVGAALPGGRAALCEPPGGEPRSGELLPEEVRNGLFPEEIRALVPAWLWERETFLGGLGHRRRRWEQFLNGETESWIQNGRRVTHRVSVGGRDGVLPDLIRTAVSAAEGGSPPSARQDVFPLLRYLRNDEDGRIASQAVGALAALRDPELLPELLRQIAEPDSRAPVAIRAGVLAALALSEGDPQPVAAALLRRVESPSNVQGYVHVMRIVTGVLQKAAPSEGIPFLLCLIEEPSFRVDPVSVEEDSRHPDCPGSGAEFLRSYTEAIRFWAANALRAAVRSGGLPADAKDHLRALLHSPSPAARLCAIRLLADAGEAALIPEPDAAAEALAPGTGRDLVRLLAAPLRAGGGADPVVRCVSHPDTGPLAIGLAALLWIETGRGHAASDPGPEACAVLAARLPAGPFQPPASGHGSWTAPETASWEAAWAAALVAYLRLRHVSEEALPAALADAVHVHRDVLVQDLLHYDVSDGVLAGMCCWFLAGDLPREISPPREGEVPRIAGPTSCALANEDSLDINTNEFDVSVNPDTIAGPFLEVCMSDPERLRALLTETLQRLPAGEPSPVRHRRDTRLGLPAWWEQNLLAPMGEPVSSMLADRPVQEILAGHATTPPSNSARVLFAERLLQAGWAQQEKDAGGLNLSPKQ